MANYGIEDLEVLSPSEHVRRRSGMYIGDSQNPLPLFNEIFDNAIDEQSAGYSTITKIKVDYMNNLYTITDYGRGFPQGKLHDATSAKDIEAVELLCTTAFSGGKFGGAGYRICSGLHGVGLLVVNSLSSEFNISTWRDGSEICYSSHKGITDAVEYCDALRKESSGTTVTFKPDPDKFKDTKIPLSHIMMRCKVAAAFGFKTELKVINESGEEEDIDTSSTIYDLLPEEDPDIAEYYSHSFTVKDEATGEYATVALKYTSDTKCYYRGYTNLLYNSQGGTHVRMLENALYDAWSRFKISDIKESDVLLGLRGVVAVFISHTEFSSQSKERLSVDKSYLETLRKLISEEIYKWLSSNEEIRESLIKRFQEYRASQNKLLARKEIKSLLYLNRIGGGSRKASTVKKLRECTSTKGTDTELWIVEGDSAMGSAVLARDSKTQAVLPVRGKVLNVARCSDPKDALSNIETRDIINAIGAGISAESDPKRSRYSKIIFMADADADGKEISVLLAGMFINLLPNLVKEGMVYISVPPLYGWKDKSNKYHFTDDQTKIPSDIKSYTRYKGLGEMDPEELKASTMDPATRKLIKLNYPDDINIFNNLLVSSGAKFKLLEDQGVVRYEI